MSEQEKGPPMLLRLSDATLRLGAQAFGPFSFNVKAGERVAILGPSGAGKSTLLKIIANEQRNASRQVLFEGRALKDWSALELSRRRAVLPQSAEVAFGLRADLVIGLGRVARARDPHLADIVCEAARLAHASHLLERRFDTLSGGEKARVQLARVFAQLWDARDALVLVDEPLAALDPGLQFEMMESMESFVAERGHALIAVLHDINHALAGFERLLMVRQGRIVHDVPADFDALPALESLYGIALDSAVNPSGDIVVTPARRRVQDVGAKGKRACA